MTLLEASAKFKSEFANMQNLQIELKGTRIHIRDAQTNIAVALNHRQARPINRKHENTFPLNTENIVSSNPNMIFLQSVGFLKNSYFEAFLDQEYAYFHEDLELTDFYIGTIHVEIDVPSELFQLLFDYHKHSDNFDGWENVTIIRLTGISNDNYENYLAMALYLIHKYNPSQYIESYPSIKAMPYEHEIFSGLEKRAKTKNGMIFRTFKYPEVIRFYNKAESVPDSSNDEIAFLFYYKILEYFFIICRKTELLKIISDYNSDKNDTRLLQRIETFYRKDEKSCLQYVLGALNSKLVSRCLRLAARQKLLKSNSILDLSDLIYNYRNSIAHGKKDPNYNIFLPTIKSGSNFKTAVLLSRKLALGCIRRFC